MSTLGSTTSLRILLGKTAEVLGTIWTAAGALKLIFGVRITLPLFPPLDLQQVSVWPSLGIGLALVFLGAWLRRTGAEKADREIVGDMAIEHREIGEGQPDFHGAAFRARPDAVGKD